MQKAPASAPGPLFWRKRDRPDRMFNYLFLNV